MNPTPLVLPSCLPTELLQYIISNQAYPTTLIVRGSKADFLASLQGTLDIYKRNNDDDEEEEEDEVSFTHRHPLLVPTLHQLAVTRHVHIVFASTISHLRAYLSTYTHSTDTARQPPPTPSEEHSRPGRNAPLLVVYGSIELHRYTSEWSAQGLGTTLAELVEAASRTGKCAVVVEPLGVEVDDDADGNGDHLAVSAEIQNRGSDREMVWVERVPMLNKSVRRQFDDSGADAWVGRTVEVGAVLGRWFEFAEETYWVDVGLAS